MFESKNLGILVATLTIGLGSLIATSADAALVAYYDFEDNVADQSGEGNDGTVSGTTTYSTDTPTVLTGKSFQFNGSSYVSVANASSLQFAGLKMSASLWVKNSGSVNWAKFFNKGGTGGFMVERNSSSSNARVVVDFNNAGNANNLPNAIDGTWQHLAFTIDNLSFIAYVDGVVTHTGTFTGRATYSNTQTLIMGAGLNGGQERFTGFMDDAALWDSILTPAEVIALANGASPINIPEPASLILLGLGSVVMLARRR